MPKKNITIKQIALEAGVSTATVSRVFNSKDPEKVGKDVRKRVLEIIEKYNYNPSIHAKGLVSGKSNLIGVQLLSLRSPLSNIDLIETIESHAAEHGYNIILGVSKWDVEREADSLGVMLSKGVDGIIWQPLGTPQPQILNRMLAKNYPLVWLNKNAGHGQPGAFNNELISGRMAAEYLIKQKCIKPAFIGSLKDNHSQQRLTGWREILKSHGLADCLEIDVSDITTTVSSHKGYEVMCKLLDLPRNQMDGAFLSGSYIALGAFLALQHRGMTLKDFPMIGHNLIADVPAMVPLPSVCPVNKDIGAAAFDILYKRINGKKAGNFCCDPIIKDFQKIYENFN
jgi:DNA-binding LacI/PurR family transcriptional regulator